MRTAGPRRRARRVHEEIKTTLVGGKGSWFPSELRGIFRNGDGTTSLPPGLVVAPSACWLDPRVVVGESTIDGHGLFAAAPIGAGEVVARLGGRVVTTEALAQCFVAAAQEDPPRYVDTITIDDDEHLVLPPGQPIHSVNHSCDPNVWHEDTFTLVARRAIASGEELTVDAATHSGLPDFRMACRCGSPSCRGEVAGDDWRRPELQARYGDHWVTGLLRRMSV